MTAAPVKIISVGASIGDIKPALPAALAERS